jgi:peptidylprolyl isomerase
MRIRIHALAAVVSLGALGACLDTTPPQVGTPIDCTTLATSLTAADPTLTTTSSGLKYRDVTVGTGAVVAANHLVAVHYAGCLTSGAVFDENLDVDPPLVFTVGTTPPQVIPGFDEGVTGMRVGGRRQLVIPPGLAYKETGNGPIPANATIVFTIDAVATQ